MKDKIDHRRQGDFIVSLKIESSLYMKHLEKEPIGTTQEELGLVHEDLDDIIGSSDHEKKWHRS
jgi:hypothetical protein